MFSRPHVPLGSEKNRCPRPPRFGCIIDAESAFESRVPTIFVPDGLWKLLPPKVPIQFGMPSHRRSQTGIVVPEDRRSLLDFGRSIRPTISVETGEELVGAALQDLIPRHSHQDELICRRVSF